MNYAGEVYEWPRVVEGCECGGSWTDPGSVTECCWFLIFDHDSLVQVSTMEMIVSQGEVMAVVCAMDWKV